MDTRALSIPFIPTQPAMEARGARTRSNVNLAQTSGSRSPPISRSLAYRKVTKPLLERRRRARITKSLDELKSLMVGPMGITEESINRLEKADILEMAVTHLQNLQSTNSPNRYQEGFNECAAEACHFLETSPEYDENVGERLVEHLEMCTGPLTIEVPRFRLTFSPPVSPVSLGCSPQPLHYQTNLHLQEIATSSPGLLMEARRTRSEESMLDASRIRSFSAPCERTREPKRFKSSLCKFQECEEMWRPW